MSEELVDTVENKVLVGRSVQSETISELVDGIWITKTRIIERVKFDGEDWKSNLIESTGSNEDFEESYSEAVNSLMEKLNAVIESDSSLVAAVSVEKE